MALTPLDIEQALENSVQAGTIAEFYKVVRMRNPSRSYFIRYDGRLHSVKAVVACALQVEAPSITARDFHASDAAMRLSELKFNVVREPCTKIAERERVWLWRLERPEQTRFREMLIDLYGRCALSGCTTMTVLEAAHVDPVATNGSYSPANGILLRVDLHKLFDADLLAIDPASGRVNIADCCAHDYRKQFNKVIFSPPRGGPPLATFTRRWRAFAKKVGPLVE